MTDQNGREFPTIGAGIAGGLQAVAEGDVFDNILD